MSKKRKASIPALAREWKDTMSRLDERVSKLGLRGKDSGDDPNDRLFDLETQIAKLKPETLCDEREILGMLLVAPGANLDTNAERTIRSVVAFIERQIG